MNTEYHKWTEMLEEKIRFYSNIPRTTKSKRVILLLLNYVLFSFSLSAQNSSFIINSESISAGITTKGIVSLQTVTHTKFNFPVNIFTSLEGCEVQGEIKTILLTGKGIEYKRSLKNKITNESCNLTERFTSGTDGIHCEIEIAGAGKPWTTKIQTNIGYKASESSKIWAPWGDPRISKRSFPRDGLLNSEKVTFEQNWTDPLIPRSFFNDTLFYGAPYFQYEKPGIAFIPFQWNLLSIPMVSILESKADAGMSIILNPGDDILDLTMIVQPDGKIIFNRLFNRISDKNILKFSFDIVGHEGDWRGGIRWMSNNYPDYFNPSNPAADRMAGLGAYSDSDVDFDVSKMNKMDFRVNWRASFDFPYMGMFIPPVQTNVSWNRFGGNTTSVDLMQQYSKKMKDLGFYVLSYFNVTEFGARMKYPLEKPGISNESDLWKSANDFLSIKLQGALLKVPNKISQETLGLYSKTKSGGAYFT